MSKKYNLKKNKIYSLAERDKKLTQLKKEFRKNIDMINRIRYVEGFPIISREFNTFLDNVIRTKIAYGAKAEQALQVAYSAPSFGGKQNIIDFGRQKVKRKDYRTKKGSRDIYWDQIYRANQIEEYGSSAGNEVYSEFHKEGEEWIDFYQSGYYQKIAGYVSSLLKNESLITRDSQVLIHNLKRENM